MTRTLLLAVGLALLVHSTAGARFLLQAAPTPELALALNRTNYWRALYQAPPLVWNNTLYEAALRFVDNCGTAAVATPGYGRNTGFGDYGVPGWDKFVDAMAEDAVRYNYSNPGFSNNTGLFTQLVWKSTTALGCAVKRPCPNLGEADSALFVCLYYPPGNVQENTFDGTFDAAGTARRFSENVGTRVNSTASG